ncbi:MAG: DUF721 domain-containing protein [Nitratireductor sp.]
MSSKDKTHFFKQEELNEQSVEAAEKAELAELAKKVNAKPHWKSRTNHLGDLMSKVLEETVAKRSGMSLDLISSWEEIAGPNYAKFTVAEKISWPRQVSELDPFKAGTLIIACDPSKAIYLQHESGQIIERLNMFFGFEAIGKIKIVQKSIVRAKKIDRKVPEKLNIAQEQKLEEMLKHIEDDALRMKLEKFGRAVIYRREQVKS